ncbi:MAG: hypothetical protein R2789_08290 [Microthrixaceae bacterium]
MVAVLFFHVLLVIPGGFPGVSTFFTLSGFPITSLKAIEGVASHRSVSLARVLLAAVPARLLPASWFTLGLWWWRWERWGSGYRAVAEPAW